MAGKKLCVKLCFFQCLGMSQPLDSATPGRPPKVPFFWRERYVFMFLCSKNCACGHPLSLRRVLMFFEQIYFLRSFLHRPHTDRFPDDVPKKLRRNRKRDSCEKKATGTEKNRNPEYSCRNMQPSTTPRNATGTTEMGIPFLRSKVSPPMLGGPLRKRATSRWLILWPPLSP